MSFIAFWKRALHYFECKNIHITAMLFWTPLTFTVWAEPFFNMSSFVLFKFETTRVGEEF